MKKEIRAVYKCDFCPKYYLLERFAVKHELGCRKNPANNRACLNCQNLTKRDYTLYSDGYHGEVSRDVQVFFCKAKEIYLHHPKNEAKGNQFDLGDDANHPMPMQCEQQDSAWDNIDHITFDLI